MKSKILIYGTTGGIGSATAKLLHSNGRALHLVGRDEQKTSALASELSAGYTCGDIADSSWVTDQILGVDGGRSTVGSKS